MPSRVLDWNWLGELTPIFSMLIFQWIFQAKELGILNLYAFAKWIKKKEKSKCKKWERCRREWYEKKWRRETVRAREGWSWCRRSETVRTWGDKGYENGRRELKKKERNAYIYTSDWHDSQDSDRFSSSTQSTATFTYFHARIYILAYFIYFQDSFQFRDCSTWNIKNSFHWMKKHIHSDSVGLWL